VVAALPKNAKKLQDSKADREAEKEAEEKARKE
jgi:hypothetical protein